MENRKAEGIVELNQRVICTRKNKSAITLDVAKSFSKYWYAKESAAKIAAKSLQGASEASSRAGYHLLPNEH